MLKINGLTKGFGDKKVLDSLYLEVNETSLEMVS